MADDKETKKKASKKKEAPTVEVIETTEKRIFPDADDRVTCVVCGHSTPKMLAARIGEDKYACSARCLAKYGRSH